MRIICKSCKKLTKSGASIIDTDGRPICAPCYHKRREEETENET